MVEAMSIGKRGNYHRGYKTRGGRIPSPSVPRSAPSIDGGMSLEGADELLAVLDAIIADEGAKALNACLRKATRRAARDLILPQVRDAIPEDSGNLRDSLKVRALKKAKGKIGHTVGFADPLFRGDTFYAGFLEFGFKHRRGVGVPADKFLRRTLYENEDGVRMMVQNDLQQWIRERNGESLG
jgi:HK97 gp10 family phage protein